MTDKIVVLTTCSTEDEAEKLGRMLVERRLAACVNVIPGVKSYYRWHGEMETAAECLLVVKSSRELFPALSAALVTAHSYETPEALALPVLDGAPNYLNWLSANLRSKSAAE